nr:unnamed protein product [Callosobruchus analis]
MSPKGHWSIRCREKPVKAVDYIDSNSCSDSECEDQDSVNQIIHEDTSFIGQVYADHKDRWYVGMVLDNKFKVPFFVDSGADANCFPYEKLPIEYRHKIKSSNYVGVADDHNLDTVGKLKIDFSYEGVTNAETVYVIRKLRQPILGRDSILNFNVLNFPGSNLKIVSEICCDIISCNNSEGDSVVSKLSLDTIAKKFEGIFSEIGELKI